jgi:mannan endo-1,4-beta-mannosidase
MCTSNADCQGPTFVCLGSVCSSATMLTVRAQTPTAAMVADKTVELQITNNGTTAVPLVDLTARYWYTYDTTTPPATCSAIVPQTALCYFTTLPGNCNTAGSPNLVFSASSFVQVIPPRMNADHYFQLGFTAAAGSLNPGATTQVLVQFHKNDWCNFTQANDYSYNASTSWATTTRVTVYRAGFLVYGTEPPAP